MPAASDQGDILTLKAAGERIALPGHLVSEVIRHYTLTRVPHSPPSLLGVVNLRGAVLPVVSLARMLEREMSAPTRTTRVVIVNDGAAFGLLVDEVSTLAKESDGRLIDLPALLARDFATLLKRAQNRRDSMGAGTPPRSGEEKLERRETLALVRFQLSGQDYALPLDKVDEVVTLPASVAEVPRADDAIAGMISLRGHLLPLIALRVLLGLDADGFDRQKARIVVTRLGKTSIGLIVDKVTAIERVSTDDVDPVPPVLTRGKGEAQIEAICRLGEGRLISVLSPARLFEREAAARIIAAAEQGGTTMSASQTQTEAVERFVIFRLGEEYYGLPIAAVDEIVRRPDHLTRVPRAPDYVEGVMNLRGKVVPVIDQRMRFVVPGTGAARNRRVVVVTIDALQAGFVVDSVSEILAVPVGALKPAPELAADGTQVFDRIATIERDGRMILLVDPKVLLDQAERDLLAALTDGAATMHAP